MIETEAAFDGRFSHRHTKHDALQIVNAAFHPTLQLPLEVSHIIRKPPSMRGKDPGEQYWKINAPSAEGNYNSLSK